MTEYISRYRGGTEFEIIIKTDNREHYKSAEEFARRLIDHAKPKTKADVIRSMSDEEMTDYLLYFLVSNMDGNGIKHGPIENHVRSMLLEDLKSPGAGPIATRQYKAKFVEAKDGTLYRIGEPIEGMWLGEDLIVEVEEGGHENSR